MQFRCRCFSFASILHSPYALYWVNCYSTTCQILPIYLNLLIIERTSMHGESLNHLTEPKINNKPSIDQHKIRQFASLLVAGGVPFLFFSFSFWSVSQFHCGLCSYKTDMFRCTTDFHECIFIYDHTKIHLKQQKQQQSPQLSEYWKIQHKN